jgi:hypothetical protein
MTTSKVGKVVDGMCGAKTRAGTPCQQPSGWGTDHVGQGRCKLHGGKSTGRPITHGRYSLNHRAKLAEKAATFEDANFGDLQAEINLLRALLQEYLDRFEDHVTLKASDIAALMAMVESIGRMEERRIKIKNDTAFGASEMQYLVATLESMINEFVPADKRADAVSWLKQRLYGRN